MLTNSPIRVLLAGAAAAWVCAPASARADVLEIGGEGASWVAGGPRLPAPVVYAAPAGPVDGPAAARASLTEVDAAAGPEDWRARVAELAAKYDISPALLEAVVWQESRWRTGAVSPVGARGLAQLMPGTARELGVNPHNPSANLEGGNADCGLCTVRRAAIYLPRNRKRHHQLWWQCSLYGGHPAGERQRGSLG